MVAPLLLPIAIVVSLLRLLVPVLLANVDVLHRNHHFGYICLPMRRVRAWVGPEGLGTGGSLSENGNHSCVSVVMLLNIPIDICGHSMSVRIGPNVQTCVVSNFGMGVPLITSLCGRANGGHRQTSHINSSQIS